MSDVTSPPKVKLIGDGALTDQSRAVLDRWGQAPFLHPDRMSGPQMRQAFDDFYEPLDLPKAEVGEMRDLEIPGPAGAIKLRIYRPLGGQGALPICLYYHGGGLAFGTLRSYDSICRRLCASSGAIIVFVDYRMIPEHRFPGAVEDAFAAAAWCSAHAAELDADPRRLGVAGDSAGGNLAAVVAQLARDAGGPAIRLQALIYPALGSEGESASARDFGSGYFFEAEGMQWFYDCYLRTPQDYLDPRISPILAKDFGGLPAAFILTAGYDGLRDDAELYGRRLADAGVPVEIHRYSGNLHGFLNMGGLIAEAAAALDDCAAKLRAGLADGATQ